LDLFKICQPGLILTGPIYRLYLPCNRSNVTAL